MTNDNSPTDIEQRTKDASAESRARAIQSLLIEKGLLSTDAVDEIIQTYEQDIGPLNGARVVAKAWTDPEYREWLLTDANAAIADLGIDVSVHDVLIEAVENTPERHNLVVCTLCSCYPWAILGLPPTWYKSESYRSRAVREPRTLLRDDFDVELPSAVDIRVWDSTAEHRYFVLPQRPDGTEQYSEEELVELVSRDAMIGVERLEEPPATDGGETATVRSPKDAFGVPIDETPTFREPWHARAFAVTVALTDEEYAWSEFQRRLVAAGEGDELPASETETAYYQQWLDGLETLLISRDLLSAEPLRDRAGEFEDGSRTAEEFVEGTHSHDHNHH